MEINPLQNILQPPTIQFTSIPSVLSIPSVSTYLEDAYDDNYILIKPIAKLEAVCRVLLLLFDESTNVSPTNSGIRVWLCRYSSMAV